MLEDTLTLYKLIVLYILSRITFPITNAQVSNYILQKEYTDYLTLQKVLIELTEAQLITSETIRNRTLLSITPEGRETLRFFQSRIHYEIRQDIDTYLRENKYTLREEVSVLSDYRFLASTGEYEAHLLVKDKDIDLADIKLSVPTEAMAQAVCENWKKKNQDIYQYLVEQLY